MKPGLPGWERIGLTLAAVLMASAMAGYAWQDGLGYPLPSWLAGIVGGLAALLVWDILNRLKPSDGSSRER